MPRHHPFTFSVSGRYYSRDADPADAAREWRERAKKVEGLGYTKVVIGEHYAELPNMPVRLWAPIPALMAVLDATTKLRVCANFTPVAFHNPVELAQAYATMDVLSEGRVEVGLGTGSLDADFETAGVPLERPSLRVRRLGEVIQILKGLWKPGPFSFDGEFYHLSNLDGSPDPVQEPGPPIFVGGKGQQLLSLGGREAQGVNIATGAPGPARQPGDSGRRHIEENEDLFGQKIRWIREAAGPRFPEMELNVSLGLSQVTDDRDGAAGRLASAHGVPKAQVLASPFFVVGSVAQIADELVAIRERYGVSSFGFPQAEPFASVVARLVGT